MHGEPSELLLRNPDTPPDVLERLVGQSVSCNRKLALHSRASAAMLRILASSPDRITRRNVASNPQTPPDVLLRLVPSFPGEFFRNPVFDLMLIENPNLLAELPVGVMKNILKREDCPDSILNWAAQHGGKSHQLAVVSRKTVKLTLLEKIASGCFSQPAEIAEGRLISMKGVISSREYS